MKCDLCVERNSLVLTLTILSVVGEDDAGELVERWAMKNGLTERKKISKKCVRNFDDFVGAT